MTFQDFFLRKARWFMFTITSKLHIRPLFPASPIAPIRAALAFDLNLPIRVICFRLPAAASQLEADETIMKRPRNVIGSFYALCL